MLYLWTNALNSLRSGSLSLAYPILFGQSMKKRWHVYCMCIVLFEAPSPRSKPRHEASSRSSHSGSSPPQYKLHSFSLLNYDKERLERRVNVWVFTCNGRKAAILWSGLSDSLQNTERVDRIPRLTSYGSRKRWRTDCSGRRPSWNEHLQPCSVVTPEMHTGRESRLGQCDRNKELFNAVVITSRMFAFIFKTVITFTQVGLPRTTLDTVFFKFKINTETIISFCHICRIWTCAAALHARSCWLGKEILQSRQSGGYRSRTDSLLRRTVNV